MTNHTPAKQPVNLDAANLDPADSAVTPARLPETLDASQTVGEIGEDATIEIIRSIAPSSHNGDDAAVLDRDTANLRTVVSTDMLLEDVHFRTSWITPYELGQKSITRNFADIEAMGAHPQAALLALALPADTPVTWVAEFARGLVSRLELDQAQLVGGDITKSDKLCITVTALGQLGGTIAPLRLGAARCGQQVFVSGNLGYAAAGLALLEHEDRDNIPAEFAELIAAQCSLERCPGRGFVARAKGVSALTDNSDGLLQDLGKIAQRSGVHIEIDASTVQPDALLVAAGEYLGVDPWQWVLNGGEGHNLMGTTSHEVPTGFRAIGRVFERNCDGQVSVSGMPNVASAGWHSL